MTLSDAELRSLLTDTGLDDEHRPAWLDISAASQQGPDPYIAVLARDTGRSADWHRQYSGMMYLHELVEPGIWVRHIVTGWLDGEVGLRGTCVILDPDRNKWPGVRRITLWMGRIGDGRKLEQRGLRTDQVFYEDPGYMPPEGMTDPRTLIGRGGLPDVDEDTAHDLGEHYRRHWEDSPRSYPGTIPADQGLAAADV